MKKILILILTAIFLTGCTPQKNQSSDYPISDTRFILDTISSISIYSYDGDKDPKEIINDTFDLCEYYENLFSRTREGSDIYKINAANGAPVEVDNATIEIINKAIEYSELTNGEFDITVGPISSLWNFTDDKNIVPASDIIEEAITHISYKNIIIDGNSVTLKDPKAALELGAIAKGYIADRCADFLKKENVKSAIINLGGNILTVGGKTDTEPFSIGVQKPFDERNKTDGIIKVRDKSVVTSGIYERYFKVDDTIYHHILDPKTGYPIDNSLEAVTIISDKSMDGDVLSTSCFLLGLDKGLELIEKTDGVEAIFITKDGKLHYSSGIGKTVTFDAQE